MWSASGRTVYTIGTDQNNTNGEFQQFFVGYAAVSFTAPLPAPLGAAHVHFVKYNELVAGCEAGTVANPKAEPGNLCVYLGKSPTEWPGTVTSGKVINPATGEAGAAKAGARVMVEGEVSAMTGTWAMKVG